MSAIPLYVVTLYPYEDGSEARYQFTDLQQAEAFADRVNKVPPEQLRDLNGTGRNELVKPWVSGTYESTAEALRVLGETIGDEDFPCYGIHNFITEDGKDPDGPAICTECGLDRIDPD